jgi:hypothetical protein
MFDFCHLCAISVNVRAYSSLYCKLDKLFLPNWKLFCLSIVIASGSFSYVGWLLGSHSNVTEAFPGPCL